MKKAISILVVVCLLISLTVVIVADIINDNEGTVYHPRNSIQDNSNVTLTYEESDCSFIEYVNADTSNSGDRSNPFLPSSVDLSSYLSLYLPTVADQGTGVNSDAAFASAYYQFTYEANKAKGITTTHNNTFCPQFPFAIAFNLADNDASLKSCYSVLNLLGCLKYEDYDTTVDLTDSDVFKKYCCDNTSARLDALKHRVNVRAAFVESTAHNDYSIFVDGSGNKSYVANGKNYIIDFGNNATQQYTFDDIKTSLYNGKLVTIECNGSWDVRLNSQSKYVIVSANSADTKALTLVGYDDDFQIDLNANGIYEPCEKGAFLAVDSHGTNATQHNGGYIWILYDAFNRVGFNQFCNFSTRVPLLVEEKYNIIGYDSIIHDDIVLEMKRHLFYTVNVVDRNLSVIGKISLTNSTVYDLYFTYVSPSLSGGAGVPSTMYPLDHNKVSFIYTNSFSGDLLFDLSDYYTPLEDTFDYRLFHMKLAKNSSGTINVSSISLIDDKETTIKSISTGFNMSGIPYIVLQDEIHLIIGDLDYDGQLTLSDVSILQAYLMGTGSHSTLQHFLADVNEDGMVTTKDLRYLTLLIYMESGIDYTDSYVDEIIDSLN